MLEELRSGAEAALTSTTAQSKNKKKKKAANSSTTNQNLFARLDATVRAMPTFGVVDSAAVGNAVARLGANVGNGESSVFAAKKSGEKDVSGSTKDSLEKDLKKMVVVAGNEKDRPWRETLVTSRDVKVRKAMEKRDRKGYTAVQRGSAAIRADRLAREEARAKKFGGVAVKKSGKKKLKVGKSGGGEKGG